MPALAVTRAETQWKVTFANPPANLVDPEMIIELQALVDQLEHTAIDQPEVSHRLVPGGGAISRLPALVGRARALELILGSVVLDGATAERYGVVNRALPDAELDGFVEKLAGELAGLDRRVLAEAKALIDLATLPADAHLVNAYDTFFAAAARLAA